MRCNRRRQNRDVIPKHEKDERRQADGEPNPKRQRRVVEPDRRAGLVEPGPSETCPERHQASAAVRPRTPSSLDRTASENTSVSGRSVTTRASDLSRPDSSTASRAAGRPFSKNNGRFASLTRTAWTCGAAVEPAPEDRNDHVGDTRPIWQAATPVLRWPASPDIERREPAS